MVEISTSLLSVKEESIKKIYDLEVAHTDYYHIDVMDGKFVEADTTKRMLEYTTQIKQVSNIPIDVHLMVQELEEHIENYLPFSPNRITFHYEACKNRNKVEECIKKIKENGVKVGISIKPETPVEDIYEFLPLVHMVLIMTVEPGKGGQSLIQKTLQKIKDLHTYREEKSLDFDIEADGGINLETMQNVKQAGVDIAVVGSAIIKSEDYVEIIKKLKQI